VSVDDVRVAIYLGFIDEGRAPTAAGIAKDLGLSVAAVEAALQELNDSDVIALKPGSHDLWLAHPFCASDAPFKVSTHDRAWDAICVWDALGVLALLDVDGTVSTACPDCGDELTIEVRGGEVATSNVDVVHYGVAANRWYEDVGYT
jgi:Alkylmercury lyase